MSARAVTRTSLPVRERVAVALDVETAQEALRIRDMLGAEAGLLKLGSALFVREGMPLVQALAANGAKIFLDLKFHDIPSVVGKAVEKACAGGVHYVTVHASGGRAMIEAAVAAAERGGAGTRILGVTVLTSLDLAAWRAAASPGEESVEDAVDGSPRSRCMPARTVSSDPRGRRPCCARSGGLGPWSSRREFAFPEWSPRIRHAP